MNIPLAEQMRPETLNDVIGQTHLLGDAEILQQIVQNKQPVSLILWGPPGTGKTTLARIIAREVEAEFIELSAVTSGKKDVERVVEHARQNWNLQLRTVLFVDEIHRFNKAQQDAFLPHVESGLITLIGATTENPSFEIIPIEAEFAEFIAKRRGIEQPRLDWLSSQPEVLRQPLLLVESNVHTNEMLLVDGHHRYRWLFLNQQKQATAWICHGYSWREYIIK
jgi:putative ATPase